MWNFLYIVRTDSDRYRELIEQAEDIDVNLHVHIVPLEMEPDRIRERLLDILEIDTNQAPVDAIVTRGSMEKHLQALNICESIPVVPMQFLGNTSYDLLLDVRNRHPEVFDGKCPKIAMLSKRKIIINKETLNTLFRAETEQIVFGEYDERKLEKIIGDLKVRGFDFIIAGCDVCRVADRLGMPAYFNPNIDEIESVLYTIRMAIMLVQAMRIRADYVNTLEEFIDYSFEALLQVGREGEILFCNTAATDLFKTDKNTLIGSPIQSVYPELEPLMIEVKEKKQASYGRIFPYGNSFVIVNVSLSFRDNRIDSVMLHLTEQNALETMNQKLHDQAVHGQSAKTCFQDLVGDSEAFLQAKKMAQQFAPHDSSVLLMGESGTGKDLFAQSIHNASRRRGKPFVAINCGAIPMNLIESELFGYVGGAFTGASKQGKIGLLEMANGGTIFLDEIGEMDLAGQVRLLRALEDRTIIRVGDTHRISIDVRVIAATNRNLLEQVEKGTFREDLYYRLNVLSLRIPPLRDRKKDIPVLADTFLRWYGQNNSKSVGLTEDGRTMLMQYDWPGNVRQLRNFCERMVIITNSPRVDGQMVYQQLRDALEYRESANLNNEPIASKTATGVEARMSKGSIDGAVSRSPREEFEAREILQALKSCNGSRSQAAEMMGISRATLWRKMKKLKLEEFQI